MDPFVAEIRVFGFNFAPRGWAFCDGQILAISQNTALFSLLGTTYGGNGTSNFALPNMQGSAPMHTGQSAGPGLSLHNLGETGGSETVILLQSELPAHSHDIKANVSPANLAVPSTLRSLARSAPGQAYSATLTLTPFNDVAIAPAGGDQPHNNMMPYLTTNFCIALQGVFPPRN
jgi:microcystin-dependent protein